MDGREPAAQVYAVSGADEGSVCHDVRARLLLAVRDGLAEGAAHVSALSAEQPGSACSAITRLSTQDEVSNLEE